VENQVDPLDLELFEHALQMLGVSVHRVGEIARSIGFSVARHVRRNDSGMIAQRSQQIRVVLARARVSVNENDRVAGVRTACLSNE
jgi:hypothetical protein